MQNLKVYKASAGSGKTFTLALEYIKLIVKNPKNYRSILAVTFTNKATAEMKQRILSQLYGIAFALPESESYFKKITEDLHLKEDFIRQNCKEALHDILHDFSFFHVETIDSFFQMVVKNLAHELQLANNLEIELDSKAAISDAVDHFLETLDAHTQVITWIMEYINECIADNKNWNITSKLKSFGNNIYNQDYQKYAEELRNDFATGVYKNYKETLQKNIVELETRLRTYGESFSDSLDENELSINDFSYGKSGGAYYFFKLKEGKYDEKVFTKRSEEFKNDANKWPSSKLPKDKKQLIISLAESTWIPMMISAEQERIKTGPIIRTCKCLRSHFNELQLLSSIHNQLNEDNKKNGRMLLAETPLLLNKLVKDSDAPFIFEKIGTQMKHIMIDEFQDTSRSQWNNFKPLLNECLAKGDMSMIVGDIKQSIYRWRNGDWGILDQIGNEFPHMDGVNIQTLGTNYRSYGNIINFNNTFFKGLVQDVKENEAIQELEPTIDRIYDDVEQLKNVTSDEGFVEVKLLGTNDYPERTLQETADRILMLLSQGAEMKDIAILVRENKYIPLIAEYFSMHHKDIPLVSTEAFVLDASKAVCTIIEALRYLNDEENKLAAIQLAHTYQNEVVRNFKNWDSICNAEDICQYLPSTFVEKKHELRLLPLFELIENIIQIFQIKALESQEAYIFYFLDQVMEFLKKEPGDILTFLKYWEETLCKKKIPAGKVSGIQILSIHKSKGLEFNHVIIPFCNWETNRKNDVILWTETGMEKPELPLAPVDFGSEMKHSAFKEQYKEELLQQWIDNINLLYVAFTRPVCNMFIIGRKPSDSKKESESDSLGSVSNLIYNRLSADGIEVDEDFIYTLGKAPAFPQKKEKKESQNPLTIKAEELSVKLESIEAKVEFKQSNKSKEFIESEDLPENNEFIQQGLTLHNIFSTIKSIDDVESVLKKYEFDGIFKNSLAAERVSKLVHNALKNPIAKDWFSGDWEVINECAILKKTPDGMKQLRPDRVMVKGNNAMVVDFKFGNQKPEHIQQVQGYMRTLKEMGYNTVEGCLWYVYKNQIKPVTL